MAKEVIVSIDCITYNHEKYITDAIESFLMQKTNFDYEILIHDDASNDKTADIIREYERKYPEIIKPIYQTENQYSKGIQTNIFNLQRAKGKYIAICEGDDYWTDPYKLQKQVDYMEVHPECTLCFHNAMVVNGNKEIINPLMISEELYGKRYNAGQMALVGFIPTASKMCLRYTMDNIPNWYKSSVVGDYPSQLIATSYGHAYCLSEVMSAYRTNISGSSTSKLTNSKGYINRLLAFNKGFISILDNFNNFSNYKYKDDVEKARLKYEFGLLYYSGKMDQLKDPKYKELYDKLKIQGKIKIYLLAYMPFIFELFIKYKELIRTKN